MLMRRKKHGEKQKLHVQSQFHKSWDVVQNCNKQNIISKFQKPILCLQWNIVNILNVKIDFFWGGGPKYECQKDIPNE